MTSISSTTSMGSTWAAQQTRPIRTPDDGKGGPLASGKSLNDVAEEKGVSDEDLVAALGRGVPAGAPTGVDPTQVLEQIASQVGGPQPPAPPTGGGPGGSVSSGTDVLTDSVTSRQQTLIKDLSKLFDTGSDDLVGQLQGGSSLQQMLQDKGITRSSAAATIGGGFLVDAKTETGACTAAGP